MRVAQALKSVFKDITIDIMRNGVIEQKQPQFHYGDNAELLLWIKNRGNLNKYPLIWYVLGDTTEINGATSVDNARLVLLQNTSQKEMNVWRSENTFKDVLYPLADKIKRVLTENPYTYIKGRYDDKFTEKDEPKYGISSDNNETQKGSVNVATDWVDVRILTFDLEININCLI